MALFESYERRIAQINKFLKDNGISSIQEAEKITKSKGLDIIQRVRDIQPICFENACWAYLIGAGLEDLKQLRSITGTMYSTAEKGVRYLEMAEGYVTGLALDDENKVIGYQFVNLGKMMEFVNKTSTEDLEKMSVKDFVAKFQKTYGRFGDAAKVINPRQA